MSRGAYLHIAQQRGAMVGWMLLHCPTTSANNAKIARLLRPIRLSASKPLAYSGSSFQFTLSCLPSFLPQIAGFRSTYVAHVPTCEA